MKKINLTFYIQNKRSQYLENIKNKTNKILDYKNKILNYKNKTKIKYNNFLIFRKK